MENNNAAMNNMCMDWNDTIENDGQEFITLPEGDYAFTVTNFERGHFPGSAKLPACNKATLTLAVDTPNGTANAKTDLILYRSLEWKIASFFRSIGMKKQGEKLVMDWNHVTGAKGWCHIKPRSYTYNDREYTANDVDSFIDPEVAAKRGLSAPKQDPTPDWVRAAEQQIAQQGPAAQQGYRQPPQTQPYPQQYGYPGNQPYPQQPQFAPQQTNWKDGQF